MFFTESVLGRLQAVSILHEIPQERTQKGERAARASGEAVSRGDAGRLAATQLTLALFFASPPPPPRIFEHKGDCSQSSFGSCLTLPMVCSVGPATFMPGTLHCNRFLL